MSDHFDDGLRDLAARAAQAHAAGPGLPGPLLSARARRRRRVHDAVLGTTSVAAVAAVVLTGATLADRPDPTPPAVTESTTPEPEPTTAPTDPPEPTTDPTPDAARLPLGDPDLPFGVCGSMTRSPLTTALAEDMQITAMATWGQITVGQPLTVVASTWLGGHGEAALAPDDGPLFLVTREGVVVALGDALGGDGLGDGVQLVEGGEPLMHAGRLDLTVCAPEDPDGVDVGAPLPSGEYELTALMGVTRIPPASVPEYAPDRDTSRDGELADVAGAAPLTVGTVEPARFVVIDGIWDAAGPPPDAPLDLAALSSPELRCSGPAPTPTGPGGLFRLTPEYDGDSHRGPWLVGEPVDLPAELSFPWAGVVDGVLEHRVDYWVVQDGVVVGRGWPGASDDWWSRLTMRDGAIGASWFASEWFLESCADEPVGSLAMTSGVETDWTPLPAGEYQVYPTTSVLVRSVTTTQGTTTAPDGLVPYLVVGEPEPIVIE